MNNDSLSAGNTFHCPHCNQESILQTKALMDDWEKIGDALICGFCGKQIQILSENTDVEKESSESAPTDAARDRLSDLLGDDGTTCSKPSIEALKTDAGEAHFCRDCEHYVIHPFGNRCQLHNRKTEPMDDCENFRLQATQDSDN